MLTIVDLNFHQVLVLPADSAIVSVHLCPPRAGIFDHQVRRASRAGVVVERKKGGNKTPKSKDAPKMFNQNGWTSLLITFHNNFWIHKTWVNHIYWSWAHLTFDKKSGALEPALPFLNNSKEKDHISFLLNIHPIQWVIWTCWKQMVATPGSVAVGDLHTAHSSSVSVWGWWQEFKINSVIFSRAQWNSQTEERYFFNVS